MSDVRPTWLWLQDRRRAEAERERQRTPELTHGELFWRARALAFRKERNVARKALERIDTGGCIEGGQRGFCLTMHPEHGLCSSCEAARALGGWEP